MDYSAPLDARGSDAIACGGSVKSHRCDPSESAAALTDDEVPVALEKSVQDEDSEAAQLKYGHRPLDESWSLFTRDPKPHLKSKARCMHCQQYVIYAKNTERVKAHLRNCPPFLRTIMTLETEQRPGWLVGNQPNKRVKRGSYSNAGLYSSEKSIRQYARPKLSMKEQAKIENASPCITMLQGSLSPGQRKETCLRPSESVVLILLSLLANSCPNDFWTSAIRR
jgi:hypothetical protein